MTRPVTQKIGAALGVQYRRSRSPSYRGVCLSRYSTRVCRWRGPWVVTHARAGDDAYAHVPSCPIRAEHRDGMSP